MKGRFRFKVVSRLRFTETEEEYQKEVQRDTSKLIGSEKETLRYIELLMYDILLEQFTLPVKFESLNTEVKDVVIKQITTPLVDVSIQRQVIKQQGQIPATNLMQVQIPRETFNIADINLLATKVEQLSTSLNTNTLRSVETDQSKTESSISRFDLNLEPKTILKQTLELDTELVTTNVESSLETLASSERQTQLPFFEEIINCDKRFPRSFSESFNSPFIVLIGEKECEWHIPIIYALKELFREITDKHPKVTFRESEIWEEGMEELVDSLDLHSLDQFTFEYKMELLDARKMHLVVDEFAKVVKGRLNSGFLQQFGILLIAVKQKDLESAKKTIKAEGLRVYTCKPDDAKYEIFCSKILGLSSLDNFFNGLNAYERYLEYTNRRFSIFVKRGTAATDKLQYPLKVATFVWTLNELRNRKKRTTNNFEELCKFVNEILENEIWVEVEREIGGKKVIPDLIYSPESGIEIYMEIETLIGTFEPLKKIDETVEKYKNSPKATIWVVLKPISAILNYEGLKSRAKAYEILYNDMKVEFKILTLLASKGKFKWNLVNINEFMRGKNVK